MAALCKYLFACYQTVCRYLNQRAWAYQATIPKAPYRANLLYREAFLRNDSTRRRSYLNQLQQGKVKIHAGVLFPHDIVYQYSLQPEKEDATLEELWNALPDFTAATRIHPNVARHTICVMDNSGSMLSRIGATNLSARNVVNALAIYFAERCVGPFHNRYLTFSAHPRLVDLSNAHTLREKLELTLAYEEVANTNIEAVFDLILQTAVAHRLTQQELPHTVLILSDMEFDACVDSGDFSLFQC